MQYSQEHLKTMVYAKFGGQTECIMGNSKIENIVVRELLCLCLTTECLKLNFNWVLVMLMSFSELM